MHPVLFQIAGHDVVAYTVMHWLGIVIALVVAARLADRWGLPVRRTIGVLAVAGIGSFVGARLFSAALNPGLAAADPGAFLGLGMGAFHLEGAIIVGVAVGLLMARWLRLPLAPLADVAAIGMALRIAVLRVGCFLAGCCFGIETDLPWGITFPVGSHAWAHEITAAASSGLGGLLGAAAPPPAVHPTQLYEAAAALAAIGLAWWLRHRGAPAGVPGCAAAAAFLLFRAGDWLLRANTYEAPRAVLVALSLACAVVGGVTLLRQRSRSEIAVAPAAT